MIDRLVLDVMVWCAGEMYGPDCSVHCKTSGSLKCNPDTGERVCPSGEMIKPHMY